MFKARIYKSHQRELSCKVLGSSEMINATARANLLKQGGLVVGDYVMIDDENVIQEVLPRENEIFRNLVREHKKKVAAANCDLMIVVFASSRPSYKRGLVDRYLVRASQWQIAPVVVFNKMDEFKDEFDLEFEIERLKYLGVECYLTSAKFPEKDFPHQGLADLKSVLNNKTAIVLGQSGVGKSKLITALTDGEVELLSQSLGKAQKGAHTTTWSEIVDCHGFEIIDSPGIRSYSLDDLPAEDFIEYFPDLEEVATQCKFKDCEHLDTSKGCAFWDDSKFTEKELDILHSRLESFHRILAEIQQVPDWKKR